MKVVKKVIYVAMASFCLNLTVSSQNITLKMSNITVKQAMDELKSRSGYSFVFSSADVDTGKKISVSSENQSINAVIEQILRGQGLTYEIQGKNIILKKDILTSVDKKNEDNRNCKRSIWGAYYRSECCCKGDYSGDDHGYRWKLYARCPVWCELASVLYRISYAGCSDGR